MSEGSLLKIDDAWLQSERSGEDSYMRHRQMSQTPKKPVNL